MNHFHIINVKKREDRRENVIKQLNGLTHFTYSFMEAIEHTNGQIGCALSHLKLLKEAKERGDKHLIVFEDDMKIMTDISTFEKRMIEIKDFCENDESDWDILYLGGNIMHHDAINQKIKLLNKEFGLYQIERAFCLHGVIWSKRAFDKFISLEEMYNREQHPEPIDVYTNLNAKKLIICPFLVYQEPGFSNITRRNESYLRAFEESEDFILNSKE